MQLNPTIIHACGKPAFAVLPWDDYLALTVPRAQPDLRRIPADGTIPHEVIVRMTESDCSIIRAWREYLGLTQTEIAARLGIRQPSYAGMEAPGARIRKSTRERIAAALGVAFDQVDV